MGRYSTTIYAVVGRKLRSGGHEMRLHNAVCTSAIFLHSPQALSFAREGQRLFWGKIEDKQKYQNEKLTQLIRYAVNNTAYYQKLFSGKDLIIDNAPILTKNILRELYLEMISVQKRKGIFENTSGGSTGEPVKFVQDKEFYDKNFGNKILFGLLNGKAPGDSEIKLWGSERDILEGDIGIKEKVINTLYNRTLLNSFVMSEDNMQQYINRINQKSPVCVWAYADSIYELARYAIKKRIKVFNPAVIISTAGVLYNEMRSTIQQCFPQSCICNQYGSREVGAIGIEVKGKKGIRIFEHSVYVEVLDENTGRISREGTGRLLVTSLINKAMPLIRFDIGDIGTLSIPDKNIEGSFTVLQELKGRINSHIKCKDGSIIHGEFFTHLFYGKPWVKNFQVVQHKDYSLEFIITPTDFCVDYHQDIQDMVSKAKIVIPGENITVSFVENIPKLKSGKRQFVLSEIL